MSVCQDSLAQYIAAFASYATSTFFLYEYLITLSAEVELFWKSGFTRTSAVFFTNRYLALAFHFLPIWLPHRLGICKGESLFLLILGLMQYPVWAAFSAMRAYSVSAETGWTQVLLPVLVFILVCVPAGINIPRIVWTGAVVQVACGCVMAAQHIPENFNVLAAVISSRSSLILADVIVIAVTWRATYKTVRLYRTHAPFGTESPPSLMELVIRDGSIYFVVLSTLNALHLIFSLPALVAPTSGAVYLSSAEASVVSVFIGPITSVLVSRFMLNLRERNKQLTDPSLDMYSPSRAGGLVEEGTLRFAGITDANPDT